MAKRQQNLVWILIALLTLSLSPAATAQEPAVGVHVVEVLVVERVGRGGRSAIFTDEIEHTLARGNWQTPTAGTVVALPGNKSVSWRPLSLGDDGWYTDPALRGGYALARIESTTDQVVLLRLVGPRHVYVNGEPRVGDPYQLGNVEIPVRLVKGKNELLFKAGRGRLQFAFEKPATDLLVSIRDRTLPDVVRGRSEPVLAGLIVTNASRRVRRNVRITATVPDGTSLTMTLPVLPPLTLRKVGIWIPVPSKLDDKLPVEVALDASGSRDRFELRVRELSQWQKRTFRSDIDGSVQYYGVVPPTQSDKVAAPHGLVLSLHGAGVEGGRQASCYKPKDWAYVVAPTNRRPFGFDWEDWGRVDALEVLAHAEAAYGTDRRRTHVTGHSMGGHGTWQLGAHFPDRFGAVAPSAGWRDFWTYGAPPLRVENGIEEVFQRASNSSRTSLLEKNYRASGVYVLHGDADKTVPVAQAQLMRERLQEFHDNWEYHEQPGAGHWWGNQCMDWPPLFEFLRANPIPPTKDVRQISFVTVSPAISADCYWARVETQRQWLRPARLELAFDVDAAKVTGQTVNVSRFTVDLSSFAEQRQARVQFEIDAQAFQSPWPEDGVVALQRRNGAWRPAGPLNFRDKHPGRAGPFKEAFRNHVVLVYGTLGTGKENAWAYAKARYDAETFWYRGNGAVDIVPDVEFSKGRFTDRNVILYGNVDTNRAWSLLGGRSPVVVARNVVKVGDRTYKGDDLACVFVYPRSDSKTASVGVVAGTGLPGMRLTHQLPYFVSGAGFPDWAVFDVEALRSGSAGIHGAGFFATDWKLQASSTAWRPAPAQSPRDK
ncbi:MAG: prolyl oligopeptidase family serine peptidase [Planctomycetota bacterium]